MHILSIAQNKKTLIRKADEIIFSPVTYLLVREKTLLVAILL
ncbi:hypothetical protein SMSK321_0190 [Streptococcus mitis SK321]|nr:hypothetical protein SMSK321_0190 [Streptococcus mitis SK321]